MHFSWDEAMEIHSEYIRVDTNTIKKKIQKHILAQQHVLVNAVLLLISDSVHTHTQQIIPL
jgi:hypothetical protein